MTDDKVECYVNINTIGDNIYGNVFKTREQADKNSSPYRIACIFVSVKKGEGLKCPD